MRYTLVLLALLTAWVILSLADRRRNEEKPTRTRIPDYSWGEMSDIFARESELNEELRKIQLYRKNQQAIEKRLSTGQVSLRNAAGMLASLARDNHPKLREMLEDRYPAISHEERMALLLLEHLETDGCQSEVIERLCSEMTTWSKVDPLLFRQPRSLKPR